MKRLMAVLALSAAVHAQTYKPAPENLKAREWFQNNKFGLFVHWGVYSVLGDGEWVMNNKKIPISEYEKLPPRFNPVDFDPASFFPMPKDARLTYITITSIHHIALAT